MLSQGVVCGLERLLAQILALAFNKQTLPPHLYCVEAPGATPAFVWTLLDAACLAQQGFAGHHPALAALFFVCVQGLAAVAEPAVAFTLPAQACDFWCWHKSSGAHLQPAL